MRNEEARETQVSTSFVIPHSSFRISQFSLLLCVTLVFLCLALTARADDAILSDSAIPPPPIPANGAFVGVSGDAIIMAANNSAAVWDGNAWLQFKIDLSEKWGASVTADDSLICIGGITAGACSERVERLRWSGGALHEDRLCDLPTALAFSGAAALGSTIFVVGGTDSPVGPARNDFYSMDLSAPVMKWQTLPPLPGPGRALPAADGQFYMIQVFGGRKSDGGGFTALSDCWSYRPRPLDGTTISGWVKIADLPSPMAGGCAVPIGQAHTLLIGADRNLWVPDDLAAIGADAANVPDPLPQVLAYHAITDAWVALGGSPISSMPVAAIPRNGGFVLLKGDGGTSQLTIKSDVRHLRPVDYLVVFSYLGLVTFIGILISRSQNTTEDFALGGRKTPWWVAALSLYATATSSISLMAIPAWNFAYNLVLLLTPILRIFVLIPQAYIVIPLIRRLNLTSTYEYLERRFNPALRLLASAQCIIFYTIGRASIVILLPSIAISATTGLNVYLSVLAMGVLTTLYTSLGGIAAVMYTDVLQAVVMLLVPVLTLIAIVASMAGGVGQLIDVGLHYQKFNVCIWNWDFAEPVVAISVLTVLLEITGFAGDQGMVQRTLSTPDDKTARRATLGARSAIICRCRSPGRSAAGSPLRYRPIS